MSENQWPLNIRNLALFNLHAPTSRGDQPQASFSAKSASVIRSMPHQWASRIERTIVEPLDIDIMPHQLLFIVGESGIGKSLLARSLLGLCTPLGGSLFSIGERILCSFPNAPYLEPEQHTTWLRSTGIIFQEPSSYLNPALSIGHQIYECCFENTSADRIESFIENDLSVSRRRSFFQMYPGDLSEGQKQRILVGMNMIRSDLQLLIADEPTSALDPITKNRVISLIARQFRTSLTSIVFITHDPMVIQQLSQETGLLDHDQNVTAQVLLLQGIPPTVTSMSVPDYLSYTSRPIQHTSELITYPLWSASNRYHDYLTGLPSPWEKRIGHPPPETDPIARWTSIKSQCTTSKYSLRDYEEIIYGSQDKKNAPVQQHDSKSESFLKIPELSFFYGPFRASPGIVIGGDGISISAGEMVGILGESGVGKTTLMKAIGGLIPGVKGNVHIYHPPGERTVDMLHTSTSSRNAIRQQTLQVVFQNPDSALDPNMSMGSILKEVMKIRQPSNQGHMNWLMQQLYLSPHLLHQGQSYLSGGERYRFALLRSLLLQPRILVVDEPFSAIDHLTREALVALFHTLTRGQTSSTFPHRMGCLIISHNMETLMKICHKIYILARPLEKGQPHRYAELVWGGHPLDAYAALKPHINRYKDLETLRIMMKAESVDRAIESDLLPVKLEEMLSHSVSQ